ncbi:calcium/sodium antiporter [Patescibacteria group bacterium]
MLLIIWILIFIGALALLIKGADWLLDSAEKIGLAAGLSPFIVGVTIVSLGTSFPELVSSIFATAQGLTDFAAASAVGSNIANIFLIIGVAALVGRRLVVTKSLIDLDLPLLAISTALLLGVLWDKQISVGEAIILIVTYAIYFGYTLLHRSDDEGRQEIVHSEIVPLKKLRTQEKRKVRKISEKKKYKKPKVTTKDYILLFVGIALLAVGAKYVVDSVQEISLALNISAGVIAITAVAFGTSLPELIVSIKAARKNRPEVAIGNIFGSNIFNGLLVIGIPGLTGTLTVDQQTFTLGVPAMAVATLLFVISGISRRIHAWEGAMFIMLYILFFTKLLGIF